MLAGDAAVTDPVCSKSPKRGEVDQVIRFFSQGAAGLDNADLIEQPIVFRTNANSRSLKPGIQS
jgi:pyrroloquinoline quinone biosynthesis protein E